MKNNFPDNSFWLENQSAIQKWIEERNIHGAPLYCSIDTRNADFKIAHVDANLFPAGFNNVHPTRQQHVSSAFSAYIEEHFPKTKKILLLGEDFTRNERYMENLNILRSLLEDTDRKCRVASIESTHLTNDDGFLKSEGWQPQLVILNSDLRAGIPKLLTGINQPIIPSTTAGWHVRSKYTHFQAFQNIINSFAHDFNLDAWWLSAYFNKCESIDFKHKQGLESLAASVEEVLSQTRAKYQQYAIKQKPYVFIKADNGTFGAGIMTAHSGDDILNINKKRRHSMHVINHGQLNNKVLVQEGIPTTLTAANSAAEHTYYLIGMQPQFRILRQNSLKDNLGNLNSKGMELFPQEDLPYGAELVLSQLATLATTFESTL